VGVGIDKGGEDAAAVGLENLVRGFEAVPKLRLVADIRDHTVLAVHDRTRQDLEF
jgi:hypothetical protein